jgi:hypothetical protein
MWPAKKLAALQMDDGNSVGHGLPPLPRKREVRPSRGVRCFVRPDISRPRQLIRPAVSRKRKPGREAGLSLSQPSSDQNL